MRWACLKLGGTIACELRFPIVLAALLLSREEGQLAEESLRLLSQRRSPRCYAALLHQLRSRLSLCLLVPTV